MNLSSITATAIIALSAQSSFAALYIINNGASSTASGILSPTGHAFRGGTIPGTPFTGISGGISAGPGIVAFGIFSTDDLSDVTNPVALLSKFTQFGTAAPYRTAAVTGNRSVFSVGNTGSNGWIDVTGSPFSNQFIYVISGDGVTLADSMAFLVLKTTFQFLDSQDLVPTAQQIRIDTTNTSVLLGSAVPDVKTANTDPSLTPGWQMAVSPKRLPPSLAHWESSVCCAAAGSGGASQSSKPVDFGPRSA